MSRPSIVPALLELERMFDFFNAELFDGKLRRPIITICSTPDNTYGYYAEKGVECNKKCVDEIAIMFEAFKGGANVVLEVLLHEMVHLSNAQKGIEDCSNRQYHRKSFKYEAERIGLCVSRRKGFGYSVTALTPLLKKLIRTALPEKSAFQLTRNPQAVRIGDRE